MYILNAEIGFANRGSRLRFAVGSGRVGSEVLGSDLSPFFSFRKCMVLDLNLVALLRLVLR